MSHRKACKKRPESQVSSLGPEERPGARDLRLMWVAAMLGFFVAMTVVAGAWAQDPVRTVESNILTSSAEPEVRIKVAQEFDYVGKLPFEILALSDEYDEGIRGTAVAGGDRYVFVTAGADSTIEKLFIVQLEGFYDSNDLVYNYNMSSADSIGNNRYRHNTWFYDAAQQAIDSPHGEGPKTRAFLEDRGYRLADDFMMSRYVGIATPDRKKEIILFYHEMLKAVTGYDLETYESEVMDLDKEAIRSAFVARGRESFEILE